MKLISHRRRESRTLRKASSPGIVLTLPARTSSRRRFASDSHKRSISPSAAESRLSTRRSARRARDSPGRFIACSANCSKMVDMARRYCDSRRASSQNGIEPSLTVGLMPRRGGPSLFTAGYSHASLAGWCRACSRARRGRGSVSGGSARAQLLHQ